jgi:hypothetical protein
LYFFLSFFHRANAYLQNKARNLKKSKLRLIVKNNQGSPHLLRKTTEPKKAQTLKKKSENQ